jgi:oxygen-dependent protoporphyrinogen oxidase
MFLRPLGVASRLIAALVDVVGAARVRASTPVTGLGREGGRFVARTEDGVDRLADAVVLATPAFAAADLFGGLAEDVARNLAAIPYVSTAVVLLVYPEGTGDALPEASGFVVPTGRAPMTAATFLSRKWPDPAFGRRAVLRCFVGAAGSEDVLEAPDEDIVDAVCRHLAAVLPLPELPETSRVVRWPRSMPQYEVGHLERVAAIHDALPAGIVVVGNAYGGVGVADAVRSANEAAERVRAHLLGEPIGTERVP